MSEIRWQSTSNLGGCSETCSDRIRWWSTDRLRRYSEGRTLSSNLVFTIWAVFGGFILHFLLSNYLTVLLMPSYEIPVETAKDLIKRDITPVLLHQVTTFGDNFLKPLQIQFIKKYPEELWLQTIIGNLSALLTNHCLLQDSMLR